MTVPQEQQGLDAVPTSDIGTCRQVQDNKSNIKIRNGNEDSSAIPKPRYGKGIKHNVTVPSSILGAVPRKTHAKQHAETSTGNDSTLQEPALETDSAENTAAVVEMEEAVATAAAAAAACHNSCMDLDGEVLPPILAPGRGGVTKPFPLILYDMLEKIADDGMGSVVSWQPHGRCFLVHHPKLFVDVVMPKYFRQTKFASFQRQLNLYGFSRCTVGKDKGAYYHRLFLRGRRGLCNRMMRIKIKGTKVRRAATPDREPNFYAMPPLDASTLENDHDEREEEKTMCQPIQVPSSVTSSTMSCQVTNDETPRSNPVPVSPVSCNKPVLCKTEEVVTLEPTEATPEAATSVACPSDVTLSSEASAVSEDSEEADEYLDVLLEETGGALPQHEQQEAPTGSIDAAMTTTTTTAVEPCQTKSATLATTSLQAPVVQAAVPTTVVAPQQLQQQQQLLQQQQQQFQNFFASQGIAPAPGATTFILIAPTAANGMIQAPTHMVAAPAPVVSPYAVGAVPAPVVSSMVVPTYCTSSGAQTEPGADVAFFEGKPFQCWE